MTWVEDNFDNLFQIYLHDMYGGFDRVAKLDSTQFVADDIVNFELKSFAYG